MQFLVQQDKDKQKFLILTTQSAHRIREALQIIFDCAHLTHDKRLTDNARVIAEEMARYQI